MLKHAFEFMYSHGAILEKAYPYVTCMQDVKDNKSLLEYLPFAGWRRIPAYLDLLTQPELLVDLIKAVLCGQLLRGIPPKPVAISVAVYDSFTDASAFRYGFIPLPLEGEDLHGGHAMCICGYTWYNGQEYFIAQNSWGDDWAQYNPLGLPGYALIPPQFISAKNMVWELFIHM